MESLTFLTDKRDGRIKGRYCANGSILRHWMKKLEVSIPTVALESLILELVIDAYEDVEFVIVAIPNTFIKTDNPKKLGDQRDIRKFRGKLSHILAEIAPEMYASYITYENGKSALYLE